MTLPSPASSPVAIELEADPVLACSRIAVRARFVDAPHALAKARALDVQPRAGLFVSKHFLDMMYRPASPEQSARSFMTQIVEVKIDPLQHCS